ncbi:uncharacterized protein N7500_000383 [Penicillium coprophilum]|uniref:uncharacterized protein n=1 Tax=Penicillium coprophilum TaxID=36646 RepID=UPI002395C455|nr:uncharacterized protein N7500_000383 [Penicillium coprophilum]KAJ5177684.1 hypothetical protein N7500_000383 [Penicillium coprophilum]
MGATSLSVIAWKAAERMVARLNGDESGQRISSSHIKPIKRHCLRGLGTSLSVIAWKAAERVVAQLDGDEGGWWASPPQIIPNTRFFGWWVSSPRIEPNEWKVSGCEHVEGSRTRGGIILPLQGGGGPSGTSLSVNVRKAAGRVVA